MSDQAHEISEKVRAMQKLAADAPGDATVEVLLSDLTALLLAVPDSERYSWLRENLGQLVVHTDGCGVAVLIETSPTLRSLIPESVDRAIDAAKGREERTGSDTHVHVIETRRQP